MLSFMLPSFLFSLAGGVIADRMRKKSIMVVSQLLNTAATAVLATIVYAGEVTFWHFIWFGLFNGTVLSISMPARFSVAPEIVGRERVVNAMALQSSTFNLSRILGPAMAGGLIALFAAGDTTSMAGVGLVFYVIAGLSFVSVICTGMLHYRGDPTRTAMTTVGAGRAGGVSLHREGARGARTAAGGPCADDLRFCPHLPDAGLQRGRDRRGPGRPRAAHGGDGRGRAVRVAAARAARGHARQGVG